MPPSRNALRSEPDPGTTTPTAAGLSTEVARPLTEMAGEINLKHVQAQEAADEAVRVAAETGDLLAEVKDRLKHGEWLPWLADNFRADVRTAQGYMRLAANAQRVSHLPTVREALKALAAPKEPADDDQPASEPPKAGSPSEGAVFARLDRARQGIPKALDEVVMGGLKAIRAREARSPAMREATDDLKKAIASGHPSPRVARKTVVTYLAWRNAELARVAAAAEWLESLPRSTRNRNGGQP
jgi:hypothetical protein